MLQRTQIKTQLLCTKCGSVGGESPCDCGPQFLQYIKAGEIARKAVETEPDKSNRHIAKKTGISHQTVHRARKAKSGVTKVTAGKTSTRDRIIDIYKQHRGGLTTDAVREQLHNIHPQTVNSAVNALATAGYLYDSGKRKKTRAKGGRPAIVYKFRTKPPPDPTETMTDEEFSDYAEREHDANPKNHYAAFLIRADQAIEWAKLNYPYNICKVTAQAVSMARRAGAVWSQLASEMQSKRR